MRAVLVLALAACRPVAVATPASAPATVCTGAITDAAWLAGAWRDSSGTIEEQWTSAAGRTMLGLGRTIVDGGTMAFEFMRIEADADGLVFIAHPSAGPGVAFRRTQCSADVLRFENPAHDFPQVVSYRREGADAVSATVEGKGPDGAPLRQVIAYRREASR